MPTNTYTAIASQTLNASAATVTFNSISGSYRDLVLITDVLGATSTAGQRLTVNGDTGSNYIYKTMYNNGTNTTTFIEGPKGFIDIGALQFNTTTKRAISLINFQDYSVTNKHKLMLWRTGEASVGAEVAVGRWGSTSAITSITITFSGSNAAAGSTFSLFGIVA